MRILFSESEKYYRDLGLSDRDDYIYEFDGMRKYNYSNQDLDCYDIFVCFMYTLPHNVFLTLKFKSLGKVTILVMDGIYDYANSTKNPMVKKYDVELYSPILQDVLMYVGDFPSKIFGSNVKLIDYLPARMIEKKITEGVNSLTEVRVLITTANSCYFDEEEFNAIVSLINLTVGTLNNEGVKYDFRIFDSKLANRLIQGCGKKVRNIISGSFESILPKYSHVITTPSSILITSMYYKKTVGMLNHRDTPPSMYASWVFSSEDSLNMGIKSFIDSDSKRLCLQNRILEKEMSKNDINVAIDKSIVEVGSIEREQHVIDYEVKMLMSMLDSCFNFNFEYLFRKIYLKFKGNILFRKLRSKVK